jgi:O-antigen ligase
MSMNRPPEGLLGRLPEETVALCGVLYLLVGRWSYARLDPTLSISQPLYEPRFILVPAMFAALMLTWQREAQPVNEDRHTIHRVALSLVAFLSYMMTTALWCHNADFAVTKFVELMMVMLAMLAFVWALSICDPERLRDAVFRYLLVFCGLLALLGLRTITDARLAVLGGGPNVYGRNMCMLAASCLYFWRRGGRAWLWLPGVGLAFILVILTGSRGALVAFSALALGFLMMSQRRLPTTIFSLAMLAIVTYLALADSMIWDAVENTFRSRVIELTLEKRHDASRGELFQGALDLALQNPLLGKGLASGRAFLGQYPHNLFLETLSDGGLVGLGLLVGCFLIVAYSLGTHEGTLDTTCLATFVMLLTSSQFSGDFYDSRGVFLFMPLIVVRLTRSDGKKQPPLEPAAAHGS